MSTSKDKTYDMDAKEMCLMSEPTLEEALSTAEKLLSRCPDRIERFYPSRGGSDSYTFRLWLASDPMLLKIMKRPGDPVGVYFHSRLRNAGLPVPELIAFSGTGGPFGQACAVWEWVEGQPVNWRKREPCPFDEAEFGELLRRIHELTFDGPFGFLGDDLSHRSFSWSPDIRPACQKWSEHFDCRAAAQRLLEKGYLEPGEADMFASLPQRLNHELDAAPCRLLHTDLRNNLMLDPATGHIRAMLDYTESTAGDPRWELALIDFRFADRLVHYLPFDMNRFRAAYGTTHNPRDALGRFYLAAILAFDELPNCHPTSLRGKWQIVMLKSVLDTFRKE